MNELLMYSDDELGDLYSDLYKELHGIRPRHLAFNGPEFDRVRLENAYLDLCAYQERVLETEDGRAMMRADGWAVDYEYGDALDFRGVAYKVVFVEKDGKNAVGYTINPIARTDVRSKNISAQELRMWERDQRDRAMAKSYGMTLEEYRR